MRQLRDGLYSVDVSKLPVRRHLARKAPELSAALVAIGEAVDLIKEDYEREEEAKPWLEMMIRAPETTARAGSNMAEHLQNIDDHFRLLASQSHPNVKRARGAIHIALKR